MKQPPLCRHCQQRPAHRTRGLCYGCFYTPEIRCLYKPELIGFEVGTKEPQAKPTPTQAYPGTEDKLFVLEERVLNHEQLWHPEDLDLRTGED